MILYLLLWSCIGIANEVFFTSIHSLLYKDNLVLKKPGTGLDYSYSKKLIGKKAKKNLNNNKLIFLKDFK